MNWIEVKNQSDIPKVYYQDRERILLEDVNGFIGVGYWNSTTGCWILGFTIAKRYVSTTLFVMR